ncbi:MAG: DsbA family protein [Gemmatimonadales bacterium]
MAGQVNLKPFYIGLAVIALAGAGWMWLLAARSNKEMTQILEAPVPLGTAAFPGYVMGSDSAPVEVVEYADFQCPACASFAVLAGPDVRERLVKTGEVRWRFRDFPLDAHDKTLLAHHAAACADEQGEFWGMHDQLYFHQGDWSFSSRPLRKFQEYAETIGIDVGAYNQCMSEARYASRIQATKQEVMKLGIRSTPSFDVGQFRVSGAIPFDSLQALVKAAGAKQ